MTQLCPDGHASEMTDFCSECGIAMHARSESAVGAADPGTHAGSAGSAPDGVTCSNCNEPHGPADVFCENCGFDFSSGSLPEADRAPETESTTAPTATVAADVAPAPAAVSVSVDVDYFAAMVEGGEVTLPDPLPEAATLTLPAGKALIGRHSESRGIFPEIDVEAITGDPAVSSRHAMLHRTEEGGWEINDLGSTNGTRLGEIEGDELVAGTAYPIAVDVPIYVGAWTRIQLRG